MTHLPNISLVHFGSFLIVEISWGGAGGKTSPQPSPDLLWLLAFGLWQATLSGERPQSLFLLFCECLGTFSQASAFAGCQPKCFYIFFRSEAFFDYLFISDGLKKNYF